MPEVEDEASLSCLWQRRLTLPLANQLERIPRLHDFYDCAARRAQVNYEVNQCVA
jgi:hypothetical protein